MIDRWGRTITPTAAGSSIDYHVVGDGQDFTQSFPAATPEDVAIGCIEASPPTHLYVEPVAAVTVPTSVTRFQAMAIMSQTPSTTVAGGTLLQDAQSLAANTGGLVELAWANAGEFDRAGEFVTSLAATLGLSSDTLDALFIAAAQIRG